MTERWAGFRSMWVLRRLYRISWAQGLWWLQTPPAATYSWNLWRRILGGDLNWNILEHVHHVFLWGYPLEKNVKRTSTRAFQSFQHFSTFSLWLANGLLSQFGRCESFPGIGHSYCRMTRHPAAVFGWAGDRERSRDWCTKGQMSRGTETPPK
jgi:hypothetical protein